MVFLLAMFACQNEPSPKLDAPDEHAAAKLWRASLALRGIPPSAADRARVAHRPQELVPMVRSYTEGKNFSEMVRDLHTESWLLRFDTRGKPPPTSTLEGFTQSEITYSIDEEPLRLVSHVITSGKPYTQIVTTSTAMANPAVAAAYGLAYNPLGPEWQPTQWADGRPAAGVLSSSGLLQRHMSSDTNHHRARANFVARGLLCDDFLERYVPDLFDPGFAEEAIETEPSCQACHQELDPLASAFWGARRYITRSETIAAELEDCPPDSAFACLPLRMWEPSAEGTGSTLGLPETEFQGTPLSGLADLGQSIANDSRFARCTTERFWSYMAQVPPEEIDPAFLDEQTAHFVSNGFDAAELLVQLALSDELLDRPPLHSRPEQLARRIEGLTGFHWQGDLTVEDCENSPYGCIGTVDFARHDNFGMHTLLGGHDGWNSTTSVLTSTPTHALSVAWWAEEAAAHVMGQSSHPLQPDELDVSDEGALRRALADLREQITGERMPKHSDQISDDLALFDASFQRHGDLHRAWGLVLTALLQDPKVLTW